MVNKIILKIYQYIDAIQHWKRSRSKRKIETDKEFLTTLENELIRNDGSTSEWISFQQELVLEFSKKPCHQFLQYETIKKTMFYQPPIDEFLALKASKNWPLFKRGIRETCFGTPRRYKYYPKSSGNLIHHAYSLHQLEKMLDINKILKDPVIFEFGGGYGSFRRLVLNMCKGGSYHIFDFPLFLRIQNWFLNEVFGKGHSTKYYSEVSSIESNLSPNLFIALWSLSECPLKLRNEFEELISKSEYVLIAFQKNFSDIDNISYFEGLGSRNVVETYDIFEIEHLPNHYYFLATNWKSQ